jgi:hypothetical protein
MTRMAAALSAQSAVEMTVHDAQPHIFRESEEAVAAPFSRREPGTRLLPPTS